MVVEGGYHERPISLQVGECWGVETDKEIYTEEPKDWSWRAQEKLMKRMLSIWTSPRGI